MADKSSKKGKKSSATGGAVKKLSKDAASRVKGGSLKALDGSGIMTKTAAFRIVPQPLGGVTNLGKLSLSDSILVDKLSGDKA
jgi:hypothetical protein